MSGFNRRTVYALLLIVLIVPILAACGGATTPTAAPATAVQPTAGSTQPTAVTNQPTEAPKPTEAAAPTVADSIIVGLAQEPDTMYSLITSMAVQRVVENAVRESWVLGLDYTFTANPRFLQGDLPTIDNGGAKLEDVKVFVDSTGAITTTDTGTQTTTKQLSVTFKMQAGLKWSDGQPLTVDDVVFGDEIACNVESGATTFVLCEKIQELKKVDDVTWTVIYKAGETDSTYFANLNGSGQILPKHQLQGKSAKDLSADPLLTEYPIGWGPYKLEQGGWKKGQSITVVKNENYVGAGEGLPKVGKVIFQIIPDTNQLWASLYAGEIDLATSDGLQADLAPTIEKAEKAGKIRAFFLSSATWEHLDFNFNNPKDLTQPSFLGDVNVRQAIAYGANRQGYVDAVYAGKSKVMNSFIPDVSWAYAGDENLTIYTYDVTKANKLLDDAGYALGADGIRAKDGKPLSFTMNFTSGNRMRERMAQLFQRDMKAIGIDVKVAPLPAAVWFGDETGLARRDFELGEFAWVGQADPGGRTLYSCTQIPSEANNWEGQNYMGWCNEAASAAINKANDELSQEARKEAYKIVQQEFTKDMPSLPLFNRLEIFASAPDLQNVQPNPSDYVTWNIAEWDLPARSR